MKTRSSLDAFGNNDYVCEFLVDFKIASVILSQMASYINSDSTLENLLTMLILIVDV